MEIWGPKPSGTLWATPGLLRDCFTFILTHLQLHVALNEGQTEKVKCENFKKKRCCLVIVEHRIEKYLHS